jgi:integrase
LTSALNGIAKALGMVAAEVPADPAWLRRRLQGVAPASIGISKKTWANTTSNAVAALKLVGMTKAHFARKQLDAPWQDLWVKLKGPEPQRALGRFMTFCSRHSIAPCEVTDETVHIFAEAMMNASLRKKPDAALYHLAKSWNKAGLEIPGWPSVRLTVPDRRVRIAVPNADLPPSFQADLARYSDLMSGADLLANDAPRRRLAAATLNHRQLLLRRFFADVVRGGIAPESLADLRALVAPDTVRTGIRQMIRRRGGETSSSIYIAACILMSIAKNYVRLPERDLSELRDICRRLRPEDTGMTAKKRSRLRQFDDPQTLGRLLHLPRRLLEDARKGTLSACRAALLVEVGLAIELLLATALRIKNLSGLHLDRNIQYSRAARAGVCHLVVEPEEVKNGQPLEFELNTDTVALLDTFVTKYRPLLVPPSSRWLFGKRDGSGAVDPVVLARRIKGVIHDRIGATVNAHLFRALTGKLFLDNQPGGYEVVRRVLGHKSMATTIKAYTGLESVAAGKHFDKTIRDLREALPQGAIRRRRRAG